MEKVIVETLEYCRICLRKVPRLVAINKEIQENFLSITQIKLIESPNYSNLICTLCERKLKNAKNFRSELIENETNLRNELENFSVDHQKKEFYQENETNLETTQSFTLEIEKISPYSKIKPKKFKSFLNKKIICEYCSKLVIKNYYQSHIQRLHLGIKNFTCDCCGKSFFKKSSLASHMHLHLNSRPFKCSHDGCEKSFLSSTALGTHIRFHHTTFNEYVCKTCLKGYKQKRLLEEHIRSKHTGQRIFKCSFDGCESAYFSMSAVRKHLKSHEFENVTCEMCGKIYKNLSSLNAHVRLSHSKIEFKCEIEKCEKIFKSKCFLKNHLKSHERIKVKNNWINIQI
ncbi:hypothetical protein PVAND_014468 [Polypedilum vanderplanki]|uniref:Zinc finger protein n=1 Tax=Polypedilum vanderplanki TaxID=319348 RepID=A0A9J6BA30_POLVA|nr:hypothetical protein PVAND_014468 [Polypedilum vanderplanki]